MPVTLKSSQVQQNLGLVMDRLLRERLQHAASAASARAAHLTEEEIETLIEDARSENHPPAGL